MSFKDHTQAGLRRLFFSSMPGPLIGARRTRPRRLAVESLESRQLLSGSPTITEIAMPTGSPAQPTDIVTTGGKLWFTEYGNGIGSLDPTTSPATITSYTTGLPSNSGPQSITATSNGQLWFTELNGEAIGTLNPATGVITNYNNASTSGMPANAQPFGITADSSGNIWFTDVANNALGEYNATTGTITETPVPNTLVGFGTFDSNIVAGPGGKLYFTEAKFGAGGSITASGIGIYNPATSSWSQVTLPTGQEPFGLTVGADGNIWFSEGVPNTIPPGYHSTAAG